MTFTIAETGSPCDTNQDGLINVLDVQKLINQSLGMLSAVNDLNGDGVSMWWISRSTSTRCWGWAVRRADTRGLAVKVRCVTPAWDMRLLCFRQVQASGLALLEFLRLCALQFSSGIVQRNPRDWADSATASGDRVARISPP